MKNIVTAILMSATLAACAVDAVDATTAFDEQGLDCGSDCDPANMATVLSALIGEGQHIGSAAGPAYCRVIHGYDDYGNQESWNECSNIYQGSGQQYLVDCADRQGPAICGTLACGEPNQPHCQ